MKRIILFYALIQLLLVSCKKSDPNNDPISLLTSISWKPSMTDKNRTTNPQGSGVSNFFYPFKNCETDDIYSFNNMNKLTIHKGDQQCSTGEMSPETGDYSVDLTNKKITIKGIVYQLAEISGTQLKYYAYIPSASSFSHLIFLFEPVK